MHLLIVGGAGYIGAHMVRHLHRAGYRPTTLDNLSAGHREAITAGEFVHGDCADRALLDSLLGNGGFDAVMHFASLIQVGESVREPARYYRNNVAHTQILLDAMLAHGVQRFIFSSTAAVYGEPRYSPLDEDHPREPINPYGRSKWMVEQMLEDYAHAYELRSVRLRYFNAAGAHPDGDIGERHDPETHLIPLVLQAALGRRPALTVHGDDYDTPDGTCIRDYIHVQDLCEAHLLALRHLEAGGDSRVYNLGNGAGFSVREVIDTARRVIGREIPVEYGPRRAGDAARLVADAGRIRRELGWQPVHADLAAIIEHAWHWEQRRP